MRYRRPKGEEEILRRERLDKLAEEMRKRYLFSGTGCASTRKAIEKRKSSPEA